MVKPNGIDRKSGNNAFEASFRALYSRSNMFIYHEMGVGGPQAAICFTMFGINTDNKFLENGP